VSADSRRFNLNVRLTQTEIDELTTQATGRKTTVSDTIRALISKQKEQPIAWEVWDDFSDLCKMFPQANPGDLLKLALRVGVASLKAHPDETKKKLGM
jgi:hypothetical protein